MKIPHLDFCTRRPASPPLSLRVRDGLAPPLDPERNEMADCAAGADRRRDSALTDVQGNAGKVSEGAVETETHLQRPPFW